MKGWRVQDWMSPDPITVDPKTTLPTAYQLMKLNGIRRLPVVDSEGRLVGIVTLGDIREAKPKKGASLSMWDLHILAAEMEVGGFMTVHPFTVGPNTSVREAVAIMLEHKIGGLPVVDAGRLVGIITESDVFRLLGEALPELEPAD
ncbi:MAG: CBS domain-containing protein [Anaerolineae bacterium]